MDTNDINDLLLMRLYDALFRKLKATKSPG